MEERPNKCPLCNHPESKPESCDKPHLWAYSCPNCGFYYVAALLFPNTFRWPEQTFRLACIAREWNLRRRAEEQSSFVLTDDGKLGFVPEEAFPDCRIFTPDEMHEAFPKGADLVRRSMLNLARLTYQPTDEIPFDDRVRFIFFSQGSALREFVEDLQEIGYIKVLNPNASTPRIRIRPKGWEQIDRWMEEHPTESRQAFVAMWFANEMDEVYKRGIKPAIEETGFDPRQMQFVQHNNKICDEIIAEIRKSRFVVADFSAGQCRKCDECDHAPDCKDKVRPRGGVYFEAGFAMGLDIPVIWTVRKDQIDQVHFDIRQYNFILYETPEDLRMQLRNRIGAMRW